MLPQGAEAFIAQIAEPSKVAMNRGGTREALLARTLGQQGLLALLEVGQDGWHGLAAGGGDEIGQGWDALGQGQHLIPRGCDQHRVFP